MTVNKNAGGVGNTRPERISKSDLEVLVDWISCTFQVRASFEEVKQFLGLGELEMEHHNWGRDTFREHLRFSNIIIQRKGDFTYQLSLSGQGCREFETITSLDMISLIAMLKEHTEKCTFTRIDIAIDDFAKRFNVDMVKDYLNEGLFVSRLRDWEERTKKRREQVDEYHGRTIKTMDSLYIGSMKSRLSINIYDKKLEREAKGQQTDGSWDEWTRTELRTKKEYADQIADMILLHEYDLGKVAFGILNEKLKFVTRNSKRKNMRDRPTVQWWARFVGEVDKLKFNLEAPERTIERSKKWVERSVAPSLAAIRAAAETPEEFEEFVSEVLANGAKRLNEKHEMMIEQAKELKKEEYKEIAAKLIGEYTKPEGYQEQWQKIKSPDIKPGLPTN